MDEQKISERIHILESTPVVLDNVLELASLYIVQDKQKNATQSTVRSELDDILPAFRNYVQVKTLYQQHSTDDDAVLHALSILCQEIREFLGTLYGSSCFYKERRLLRKMLEATLSKMQE